MPQIDLLNPKSLRGIKRRRQKGVERKGVINKKFRSQMAAHAQENLISPVYPEDICVAGFYVYILKTTKCKKVYIGVTNDPTRRFYQHLTVSLQKWKTLTDCGRAVKRYGAHTFTMVIKAKCKTAFEAGEEEAKWIKRFGKPRTWNSTSGGYVERISNYKRGEYK